MGRGTRGVRLLVAAAIVLTVAASGYAVPHFWVQLPGSAVARGGSKVPGARVYRSLGGELAVLGAETSDYLIRTGSRSISVPNGGRFLRFGGMALAKDRHPEGKALDGPVCAVDPRYVAAPGLIAFTGLSGARIALAWDGVRPEAASAPSAGPRAGSTPAR